MAPTSLHVAANGLDHHVLEWRPDRAEPAPGAAPAPGHAPAPGTVVLIHGYMDAAGTWDEVAPALASAGLRVLAPDMRGFGEGPRAREGGYYHFPDYVLDLTELLDALAPGEPVALVGHSMGGTIVTLFAGTFPGRVSKLASLEGLGPPDNAFEVAPARFRRWIDDVRKTRARQAGTLTREEARQRLAANHPKVAPEVLARKLPHLVAPAGDGRVAWRFDPLHRTTSPSPFFARQLMAFAKEVPCPVLFVSGGAEGFHPPDEEERLSAFPRLERAVLEGAGHMMHWTKPRELSRLLVTFLT